MKRDEKRPIKETYSNKHSAALSRCIRCNVLHLKKRIHIHEKRPIKETYYNVYLVALSMSFRCIVLHLKNVYVYMKRDL